jgi:phage pi2 protein 07
MYTYIKESGEMLKDYKQRISHDLDELYEEAEQENNGIFAYPHESKEEREETKRLMNEFIKKNK